MEQKKELTKQEQIDALETHVEKHAMRGGRQLTEPVTFADLVQLERDGTFAAVSKSSESAAPAAKKSSRKR